MAVTGCGPKPVNFPTESMPQAATKAGAFQAFDGNHDGRADFFLFTNAQGRVNRIGYCYDGTDVPRDIVNLDQVDTRTTRHLVIVLDGVGYDVLKKFYDQGHLRYFHRPSRVIAPYPSLTDLALEDALGYIPAKGMEASYFDHRRNEMAGGAVEYLKGSNQPYDRLLQYRADLLMDGFSYIMPSSVYGHELNDAKKLFDRRQTQEMIAYFVGSAGLGTANGEAGHIESLAGAERLINQLMYETHGQLRVTMFADHGHSYTHAKRIPLEAYLKAKGWNVTEKIQGPRDVVYVRFGLETYASFCTTSPRELAQDLVKADGVEIASHVEDDSVLVDSHDGGKAVIKHLNGSYTYKVQNGDPLKIEAALKTIPAQADGSYKAADLLKATIDGQYPLPLQRMWRAHYDLVENPPDVIISLENGYYSGSGWMDKFIDVASTHGGLNRANSTTFIMSTMGEMPPVMQSREISPNVGKLLGETFPRCKP